MKTAAELNITEEQRISLTKAIFALENEENIDFSMCLWEKCIAGIAERIGNLEKWSFYNSIYDSNAGFRSKTINPTLRQLIDPLVWIEFKVSPFGVKPKEAARAINNYLTTGEANWKEVFEADVAELVDATDLKSVIS